MSVISSTIEAVLNGFTLANVKELAHKAAHAVLDLVDTKAESEGAELLIAKAADLGITIKPVEAAALVRVVLGHVREHI